MAAAGLVTLTFERKMPGQHAFATDRGLRRSTNQDRAFAERLPDGRTMLVVADGVGGMHGGEIASEETVRVVIDEVRSVIGGDAKELLRAAVSAANRRVRERREEEVELAAMATTLVLAIVGEGEAWIVNIGDSRAYVFSGETLEQVTEDDSWLAEQVRLGIITEAEAAESPRQNVITRGIGVDEDLPDEKVIHVTIEPGGMLLLCSDGLFRAISSSEMVEVLKQGNVKRTVSLLIERANAAGGPDNIGVALYRRDVDIPTENGETTLLGVE